MQRKSPRLEGDAFVNSVLTGELTPAAVETYEGNIDAQDLEGGSPVFYAAREGNLELVKALRKRKALIRSVRTVGCEECDALSAAMERGHVGICKYLIESHPDKRSLSSTTDSLGRTYLHLAAYYKLLPVCKLLRKENVNALALDKKHRTPLEYAQEEHSDDDPALLLELERILPRRSPSMDGEPLPKSLKRKNKNASSAAPQQRARKERDDGPGIYPVSSEKGCSHVLMTGGSRAEEPPRSMIPKGKGKARAEVLSPEGGVRLADTFPQAAAHTLVPKSMINTHSIVNTQSTLHTQGGGGGSSGANSVKAECRTTLDKVANEGARASSVSTQVDHAAEPKSRVDRQGGRGSSCMKTIGDLEAEAGLASARLEQARTRVAECNTTLDKCILEVKDTFIVASLATHAHKDAKAEVVSSVMLVDRAKHALETAKKEASNASAAVRAIVPGADNRLELEISEGVAAGIVKMSQDKHDKLVLDVEEHKKESRKLFIEAGLKTDKQKEAQKRVELARAELVSAEKQVETAENNAKSAMERLVAMRNSVTRGRIENPICID